MFWALRPWSRQQNDIKQLDPDKKALAGGMKQNRLEESIFGPEETDGPAFRLAI